MVLRMVSKRKLEDVQNKRKRVYRWRVISSSIKEAIRRAIYHRLPMCCIRAGDTDGGGLDMVRPLAGLMMGIALRARVAAGACNFKADW